MEREERVMAEEIFVPMPILFQVQATKRFRVLEFFYSTRSWRMQLKDEHFTHGLAIGMRQGKGRRSRHNVTTTR